MSRKALKINVTLKLHAVSCPGVRLYSNNEVYMSICLFGHYRRTRLAEPVFPILFQQRFKFEKIFYSAMDPSEVAALLESEAVLFELVQLSDNVSTGAELLASYEDCARDFLYPCPQLSPTYSCMARETLMEREPGFPGIAPKIEFSTSAVVVETIVPRRHSYRKEAFAQGSDIYEATSVGQDLRPTRSGINARSFVYPDEVEADKGYQQQTVSSVSHSRSPSPGKLNLSDLSLGDSPRERPDFVVRKVEGSLTRRMPGSASPPRRFPSPTRLSSRLSVRSTASAARGSSSRRQGECVYCMYPHSEGTCSVCNVYKQHTGRRYWGHTYLHPSTTEHAHHLHSATVRREPPATAQISGYETGDELCFTPSEDSDSGSLNGELPTVDNRTSRRRHARTWSAPPSTSYIPSPPYRPVSPVVLRRPFKDRYGSANPIEDADGRRTPDFRAASPTPSLDADDEEAPERRRLQRHLDSLAYVERELELARIRR